MILSTPALRLLPFTCRSASFRFSRSQTSSISQLVLAGLSGPVVAINDSVPSPAARRAAPVCAEEVQVHLDVLLLIDPVQKS